MISIMTLNVQMVSQENFQKIFSSIIMHNQTTNLEMPFHLICKISIFDSLVIVDMNL